MKFIFLVVGLLIFISEVLAKEVSPEEELSFDAFVKLAMESDQEFEIILLEELKLKYQYDVQLPSDSWVPSIKSSYSAIIGRKSDGLNTLLALNKLFPESGTDLEISLESQKSNNRRGSTAALSVSQDIARNAFGKSVQLQKKLIGLENDIASHQIIEAYEDLLATIMVAYIDWWESYNNLAIVRSSFQKNQELLKNIQKREKKQIALPIDVNKVKIQILSKKERLVELEESVKNRLRLIKRILRNEAFNKLPAVEISSPWLKEMNSGQLKSAYQESRTHRVLQLLEKRSQLNIKRETDDLLPSVKLFTGFESSGDRYAFNQREDRVFLGVDFSFPVKDRKEEAEKQLARIDLRKSQLQKMNTRERVFENISSLTTNTAREKKYIAIIEEKIKLAQAILEDEKENYSFGKVTLNDYIDAVNDVDNNQLNLIFRKAALSRLTVETLRLLDRLIQRNEID